MEFLVFLLSNTLYGIRARTKNIFTCKSMGIAAKFNYAACYPGEHASLSFF